MKNISFESIDALMKGKHFSKSNMMVLQHHNGNRSMYLHGNEIVTYKPDDHLLILNNCGWQSNTTKERLNSTLQMFNVDALIYQKNYVWYIEHNGKKQTFPYNKDYIIKLE